MISALDHEVGDNKSKKISSMVLCFYNYLKKQPNTQVKTRIIEIRIRTTSTTHMEQWVSREHFVQSSAIFKHIYVDRKRG